MSLKRRHTYVWSARAPSGSLKENSSTEVTIDRLFTSSQRRLAVFRRVSSLPVWFVPSGLELLS